MKISVIVIILSVLSVFDARPVKKTQDERKQRAKRYLMKYGYMDHYVAFLSDTQFRRILKRFQQFANLQQTGIVDAPTSTMMDQTRCGLRDPQMRFNKLGEYIVQGTKFHKKNITWWLERKGKSLDKKTILSAIKKAMKQWSKNIDVNLVENKENPDILIRFVTGYHEDPYSFNGRGHSFGHAFYPLNNKGLSGDIHIDEDENFTADKNDKISSNTVNLLWAITHLTGHSLGLEHQNDPNSIMYPWHVMKDIQLDANDIKGAQKLYGPKRSIKTPSTKAKTAVKTNITMKRKPMPSKTSTTTIKTSTETPTVTIKTATTETLARDTKKKPMPAKTSTTTMTTSTEKPTVTTKTATTETLARDTITNSTSAKTSTTTTRKTTSTDTSKKATTQTATYLQVG
ncbi:matrilysin-like [Hydractinia symbiolongicarpus]|uniref:matrilysin-like n=1 Tax=Hydractinia symbiolongicarpus TaxID=13093 RepID=UPI00254C05A2|nr:matrilysin-like [Hydractinia symbiolongicarpus]